MRRPLKPFVTEYKQSSRRSSPQLVEQLAPETDGPRAWPTDLVSAGSDDSYEAAMRAADALFSGAPTTPARETRPFEQPPAQPLSDAPSKPEKNGGRILRVIDEAPSPQFVALEAERAPKRRGRKPGSKNKPKAALVSKQGETADRLSSPRPAKITASTAPMPSAAPVARIEALVAASRAPKRPSWGRDRLRPGEDWKRRRLPRVCW